MPAIRAPNIQQHRGIVRQEIIDAFEESLAQRSFADVTLGDVAGRAGVARSSIYRYFDGKSDLLVALLARLTTTTIDLTTQAATEAGSPTTRLQRALATALRQCLRPGHRQAYGAIPMLDSADRHNAYQAVLGIGRALSAAIAGQPPETGTGTEAVHAGDTLAAWLAGVIQVVEADADIEQLAQRVATTIISTGRPPSLGVIRRPPLHLPSGP